MYSDSPWISPLIDTVKGYQQSIQNLVSPVNNYYAELYTNGRDKTKYVSQVITLADGQDAEDIKVYVTGSRPINTDIEVYVRFLNDEDPAPLTDKVWTKLNNDGASVYCSPLNPFDFK